MTPELVKSHTYHKRIGGPDNSFRYSIDYVLSEPESKPRLPLLLSRNQFNIASVNDRDHGGARGKGSGAVWVREVLERHGLEELRGMRVLLLAQPRVAGFLFNPVSFWLIVDQDDRLRAFIAEVNNTMGDRHSYLCHHDDLSPISADDTLTARKVFHVSPFQKIGGTYSFRFDYAPGHVGVRIDFRFGNGGLLATLTGKRQPLTSAGILSSVIRRPFGSLRVVGLIHMQALKLLWKRAPFTRRPEPPEAEISRG